MGQDIHGVRRASATASRSTTTSPTRCAASARRRPAFLLETRESDSPLVHLFDEPQFNTQDGYIGFMLDFFRRLRGEGRLVFLCLHPNEPFHLEILREVCERFIFVEKGRISLHPNFDALAADPKVARYLGQSS